MSNTIEKIHRSPFYYSAVVIFILYCLVFRSFSHDFLGIRLLSNQSFSMSPSIDEGSVTVIKAVPDYEVGDIIAFYDRVDRKEIIVSHRIVRIGGNIYLTKGDTNVSADENHVIPRHVIGKVVFIFPFIGYFFRLLQNNPGTFLLIILPALFFTVIEGFVIVRIVRKTANAG